MMEIQEQMFIEHLLWAGPEDIAIKKKDKTLCPLGVYNPGEEVQTINEPVNTWYVRWYSVLWCV